MRMQRLDLDFQGSRHASGWAGYALLVVSLALAADLAATYVRLESRREELSARLRSAPPRAPVRVLAGAPADANDYAFARDTFRRLSTPWHRLFTALEGAQNDRVALLSIEPDADAGTVSISAEARTYLDALTYVANLAEQKALSRVYLVRHELGRGGGARPVSFTVSAAWQKKP